MKLRGKCSIFGGPDDAGMMPEEDLSLYWTHEQCDERPDLFYPRNPSGPRGTSKRLRPEAAYIAIRFDKSQSSIEAWRWQQFIVTNPINCKSHAAFLVDFGPHERTDRVVDISPGLAKELGVVTDDILEVTMI